MRKPPPSPRAQVRRLPDRAAYDRETIHAILDEGLVCHVGLVSEGQARRIRDRRLPDRYGAGLPTISYLMAESVASSTPMRQPLNSMVRPWPRSRVTSARYSGRSFSTPFAIRCSA